jgi:hypothetical protein
MKQLDSSYNSRTPQSNAADKNYEEPDQHNWPTDSEVQNKATKCTEYQNAKCFSDVVLTFLRKLTERCTMYVN